MSLDQRLRNGLHGSASRLEPEDHVAALVRVQARARRADRTTRWIQGALAVAAIAVAVAVLPPVVDRLTAPDPPVQVADAGLEGTYVADVADTAAARRAQLTGRWVITFGTKGVLSLNPPPEYAGTTAGTRYEVDGQVVSTDALIDHPGCQSSEISNVGTYEWRLDDDRLRLSVVRDSCQARVALLSGQEWARVP